MHALDLVKPDGRQLTLYSHAPLDADLVAPSPFPTPLKAAPHLRWHPLRGEWVTYAAYRQNRTFLPPPEYNPLAPTADPACPTELPGGDWQVAVFDNRFPALRAPLPDDAPPPLSTVPTAPASGHCEVTVYTRQADAALGRLPLTHLELLLEVWADRSRRLAQRGDIAYVLPFENRGVEVGATLHHPHGQTYAYPVVPPVAARMLEQAGAYRAAKGIGVLEDLIGRERSDGRRMLYEGPHAVAFVPPCARYPYEVWVAPITAVAGFADLDDARRRDLACALKTVLLKYDGLWQRPMPYVMAWYQAPTDRRWHPQAHLHAEFFPPYRSHDRLKYLAGTEIAAGFFAVDALPEDKARELQQVAVQLA